MVFLSDLNKERKRFVEKATDELSGVTPLGVGREFARGIRTQQKRSERAAKQAKEVQARQMQAALLEQAVLGDEVARRSRIAQRGGRRSLLSMGETGSLLV